MLLTGTVIQGLFYMKCRKVGVSQWADCGKVEQLLRAVQSRVSQPQLPALGSER